MLSRPGNSLVELLVALVLAAVVLGSATTSLLTQQRMHARIVGVGDADAQLRATTLVVAGMLAPLDPSAGDLTAGQARDSAIQFRALVAVSFSCDTQMGSATLVADTASLTPMTGAASTPRIGDSLWWRADSVWHAAPVTDVNPVTSRCTNPISATGPMLRLTISTADTIAAGTPLRVTRQTRLGIYRASDGTWQLGFREWNATSQQFSAPQPLAGPLLAAGNTRSGFRYFDTTGTELRTSSGPTDVSRVALIRLVARIVVGARDQSQDSIRTDSVDVALGRTRTP